MLRHQSMPGNAYNTSTQGGITLDYPDGVGPLPHHNEIWNNQLVDTVNGIHIPDRAHDNFIHDNRVIQDGKLPDGTQMGNGWSCMSQLPGAGSGNVWRGNVVGYVNRDGQRVDWWPMSQAQIDQNTTLPNPVTRQMELDEWTRWQAKLAANGIAVDPEPSTGVPSTLSGTLSPHALREARCVKRGEGTIPIVCRSEHEAPYRRSRRGPRRRSPGCSDT